MPKELTIYSILKNTVLGFFIIVTGAEPLDVWGADVSYKNVV